MFDDFPVSGTLNNCGLHVLVPRVLALIQQRSLGNDSPYDETLNQIKSEFEGYYGISPLSWENFYNLLVCDRDPYVPQIYLGIILRTLLPRSTEYPKFTELEESTGRFAKLEASQINAVANRLGCCIHYQISGDFPVTTFDSDNPAFQSIHIYFDMSSEHWNLKVHQGIENQPNHSLQTLTDIFNYGVYQYSLYGLQLLVFSLNIRVMRQSKDTEELENLQSAFDTLVNNINNDITYEQTGGQGGRQSASGLQAEIDAFAALLRPRPLPVAGQNYQSLTQGSISAAPQPLAATSIAVDSVDTPKATKPPSAVSNEQDVLLNSLFDELKKAPSRNWSFFSAFSRDDKIAKMAALQTDKQLSTEKKFRQLVQIATTQRTRLGFFCFYASRNNSFRTHTGQRLLQLLSSNKYKTLREALKLTKNSSRAIEIELNSKYLRGGDYSHLFSLTGRPGL